VRLRTAGTLRAIDRWKEKAGLEVERFYGSLASIAILIPAAPQRKKLVWVLPLAVVGVLDFAFLEFALLVLLGLLTAKLSCYRLFNSMLRRVWPVG